MAEFTHLHLHSHYSLLDGAIHLEDLIEAAVADKMSAVALTDHGNMFGALDFYMQAKEAGIKPILGAELYLAPGSRLIKQSGFGPGDDEIPPYGTCRSGMHHVILLVQNEVGYQNLCHLVSIGYLEGFYYKPRIDKEVLAKYSEGLVATSACMKGEVAAKVLMGDMDGARAAATWYRDTFGGRYYLEMQSNGLPQQMLINSRYQQLAGELGIKLVATADVHYLKKSDAFSQEVLMAIQSGRTLEDTSGQSLKTDEFYFKPQAVIKEEFSFCPEAVSNTMEVAEMCNFEFRFKDAEGKKIYHYPKFEPPGETPVDFLNRLSWEGLEQRLKASEDLRGKPFNDEERAVYKARMDKELHVINSMGFTGYFLIVQDFINWAKANGVPVGPGRGSGAGSLAAYCLRITDLDPLEHGLLFERFLNPERISLPDFDVDFCMDKRDRVIKYVIDKYGKDQVAQIATFGKLQARGVIRDVGRTFGMLPVDVDKIAKLIPEVLNITLDDAFQQEPRLRALTEKDPKLAQLFDICRLLEGFGRHASMHAAGIVISNRPMVEHCPLFKGKNDELIIQYDMNNADRIGLIKFDFLGLKTLTFLQAAEDLISVRHPDDKFKLDRLNLADKKMYELLTKGDTFGVFQLESSGMQDLMKKVKPDNFADVVASIALYRPGPIGSGMLDDFISRKHGQTPVVYDFESLREVLNETYGVIVYQEQVQQISMTLAGYTAGGADLLRRAMGKKKPEEMAKQKTIFMEGALKNQYDPTKAEKVFDLMEKFAGYGFNKSHSAAYALITCQTAYIKAHYQVEFYAALLSTERENTDKITKYIGDAKRHGISVLAPDINESETDFTVLSENTIRFGLGAIKGVGQIAIDCILEERKKGGNFEDLFDFSARCDGRKVNKRVLEAFVKGGAFDSFAIHRASLFATVDAAMEKGQAFQKTRDDNQAGFADLLGEHDTSFNQREVSYSEEKPWERLQELRYEKETVGFYVTGHPLDDFETELSRYTTLNVGECQTATSSKDIQIGVTIAALREIFTKRGDRMAFATFEDQYGQMEAVIFSDVYLESEELLKAGEPVWVKAQVEVTEGGNKILLSKKSHARILPLRFAYETLGREMHVKIPLTPQSAVPEDKIRKLQVFLTSVADKNGVPVYLHLAFSGRARTTLRMKEMVPLKRDTVQFIRDLLQAENATVDFR